MDVGSWIRRWVLRHPLKTPAADDRQQFTADVMARIKALEQPAPQPMILHSLRSLRSQWAWPRIAVVASTAALVALVAGRLEHAPPKASQVVQQLEHDAQLLAALGEPAVMASSDDLEELAQELEDYDTMLLAQSGGDESDWIEHTMELLDQLNEDPSEDATGDSSDEDWLRELEFLDDSDLAASS